jgi:hypothetical protein
MHADAVRPSPVDVTWNGQSPLVNPGVASLRLLPAWMPGATPRAVRRTLAGLLAGPRRDRTLAGAPHEWRKPLTNGRNLENFHW